MLSRVRLCDPMNRSTPGLPVHHQLPVSTQTHVHGVGDAIQPSHPLSSPSPPTLNLSQHQGLFKWVSSSHQVAKVLEFQLQHHSSQWSPSNEYSGLLSFRMDWLELFAVQGTLESLLQHYNSKASILGQSAFFIVPSVRFIPFLSFIEPIFSWNVPLLSLILLKRVFPILLLSSIYTDYQGRLSYLSLLFFGTLHSNGYIFPFLLCLELLFLYQLFLRPSKTWESLGLQGDPSSPF